ncbi:4-hydroxybenzoate octaprenyltransferase [Pseudoalteromonas xiamenensis]|uniref:4-hydroxybenzoate octaprenyltransferase n=1 Tax=Pseudoalteromonas xiamenensis TaxID=882626 RepID=A0A975DFV2_9GAMM|nr:4-hydroxybenzoate octaprenyltransferase [Pseudoalteromonas xiamenensis]QTH70799.1 4-hydroxybenzoate octaprenyltransferase [Pseudoalteromonas xiamenensis]
MTFSLKRQHWPYYQQLMRTDKPIGTFLLLWPTMWALWIANEGFPPWLLLFVFTAGVFIMRSAGCVINDYADRRVDGAVKRTSQRPLASGKVTSREALTLFAVLLLCAFVLVLFLNWQTIALSFGALALATLYPFMKRFTHLPQFVLGAAFSFAIPMVFMASNENTPLLAWALFTANCLWTVAYDTMYAMVDRDDDLQIGVKSTAILFGKADRQIIFALNAIFVAILVGVGLTLNFGISYWVALSIATALLLYQQKLIHQREREACFKAFLNNHYVGMFVFVGIVLQYVSI